MVVFASNNSLLVRTGDGRNFELQEPVLIQRDDGVRFKVPIGAMTDGASTPCELWPTLPPFGEYWLPCVVHDSAYRGTLMRQCVDGSWVLAMLPKEESDTLLLDCMVAKGVNRADREVIFEGVSHFGWRAFHEDRNHIEATA